MGPAIPIRTLWFSTHPNLFLISPAVRISRSGLCSRRRITATLPPRREAASPDLETEEINGSRRPCRIVSQSSFPTATEEEEEQDPASKAGYSGGGKGSGRKTGEGGENGDENSWQRRMGESYLAKLRSDPRNPLLLRNYATFLLQVMGDVKNAEEYYGRAVVADPGDGEVLSLYGKLVWEQHEDWDRAESYFQRAVHASPDDCYVLGSYAHFLWQAEEDDDKEIEA